MKLKKINDFLFEIPKQDNMLVPARIYTTEKMLSIIRDDESLIQIKNVATLPGIEKYSIAMPDIHEGYGFPIGGVAAVNTKDGFISPGGVGYDINCGVRLLTTDLKYDDIKNSLENILYKLYSSIPCGVGSKNAIKKLSHKDFKKMLKKGAKWAVEQGYGNEQDLKFTENQGCISNFGWEIVSERAIDRGREQLGTLGSGNHFLEIQKVEKIFNNEFANIFGLEKDQIVILFHTGSRGFGYQVCDDFLKIMRKKMNKYGYSPPDKQLIAMPFYSEEGQNYFNCMNAAANFAWTNRQIIKGLIEKTIIKSLKISPKDLNLRQIYDVCHNIAKIEFYDEKEFLVHRKGATRSFPPNSDDIPNCYKKIGQPVIIPGDMGTASYLLTGTEKAYKETFGSTCHGAGRVLSRKKALKKSNSSEVLNRLEKKGIIVLAKNKRTIVEEMPEAYKDIDDVINVVQNSGISNTVAKFIPLGVIKG